ncbi:3-hydroxyacyl-ACP dehydratase FabZ [Candidatus Deianiraea vastatrix]|uniref:3-hydroxyacyl-[acyl-carrier-protein] dehydratase FabZ n=1 Tax=Candidatus Deianiraea vastatrix TaxID=2163644 RepID=A0A5B8XD44_9RICK|nr:3-hydroxyacyl-ACP dehydratase FabZ [Candidatus Deianiraea vastatrix]QED23252.1 3-hydroxyacyl-[acyl-carrier-protein] dehydratase FabZ [Candidatus Deianiraea vastatrix]
MIDIKEIISMLPHRYPFLLVDKVTAITPKESITAIKNVTINEEFFQGHFPNDPVMPGVLIVESIAQAAALLAIKSFDLVDHSVYFMSIDSAKFRKIVRPGDTLVHKVKFLKVRGSVYKFAAESFVDDVLACEAEITAMVPPKSSDK